jgi:hypothetical protein
VSGQAEFGLPILIERTFRFSEAQMMTLVAQKMALSVPRLPQSAHEVFLDSRALENLGCRTKTLAGDALVKE